MFFFNKLPARDSFINLLTIAALRVTFLAVYFTLAISTGITRSLKNKYRIQSNCSHRKHKNAQNLMKISILSLLFTDTSRFGGKRKKTKLRRMQLLSKTTAGKRRKKDKDLRLKTWTYPRSPSRSTHSPAYFSFTHGTFHPITTLFFYKNYTTARTFHTIFRLKHFLHV